MSESPAASGEPVLAWLERRTSLARLREAEFDDAKLEYRRLFSELWARFFWCLSRRAEEWWAPRPLVVT